MLRKSLMNHGSFGTGLAHVVGAGGGHWCAVGGGP